MVLVPTRSRPHNMRPIIDAWWETGAFEVAQLRFIVDKDDAVYDEYCAIGDNHAEVVLHEVDHWEQLVPKLNRAAVELAVRGDFQNIAFMGDDHLPRTKRWAHQLIDQHMVGGEGKGWFQWGRDGLQDGRLPTWWSVDRRWVMALGKMVPGNMLHLYCDNAMKTLAQAAAVDHYNPDILIEHRHPIAKDGSGNPKALSDPQYRRVNSSKQYQLDQRCFATWVQQGLARDVSLLQDALGG